MKYNKNKILLILILAFILPMALQSQTHFQACGYIYNDSGCAYLNVDGVSGYNYLVDSTAGLNNGTWACIYGIIDPLCDTSLCSVIDCVNVDSIFPGVPPDTVFFNGCGVLIPGTNCLIFNSYSGPGDNYSLILSNYGSFGIGDSVCVSGIVENGNYPDCPEAVGTLLGNSIESWLPASGPISECGILLNHFGCLAFQPFSQQYDYYILDYTFQFTEFDTVCVAGTLIPTCDSGCIGVTGCIAANSIYPWNEPDLPYENCGVIVQGQDCILFAPLADTILIVIDTLGDLNVNDTICVSGTIDWSCNTGCVGALGCLNIDFYTPRNDFYNEPRLIIKLEEGFNIDYFMNQYGGIPLDSIPSENLYLVLFPINFLLESIALSLDSLPGVIFAQPNFSVGHPETFHATQSFPDDSQPTLSEGISPVDYFSDESVYTINSDSANILSSGEDVIVAVIDNGIDFSHPLFDGRILPNGFDFVDGDTDPSEVEGLLYGHGTFVAGIIRRVAPSCKILPIRAFNALGYGDSYNIAAAIFYAIENSADVINMSFGNYNNNPAVQEAILKALENKISMVSAAGNDGSNLPTYPAVYPGVISVSAIDSFEYIADFSNYGDYLDICAPGVNIYSSLTGTYQWGTWSGTSFAAPIVAGVCALIKAENKDIGTFEIERMVKSSAQICLDWGNIIVPSNQYGYGKIDAFGPVLDTRIGDVNDTRVVDILDIIYLIEALYVNGPDPV
ncbi:MAG: S8 family serine peptidase, partial [Candidatus Zixiibacteriota bacterium]